MPPKIPEEKERFIVENYYRMPTKELKKD